MIKGDELGLNPEDRGCGLGKHTGNDSCGELGIMTGIRLISDLIAQDKAGLRSVRLGNRSSGLAIQVMRSPGDGWDVHKIVYTFLTNAFLISRLLSLTDTPYWVPLSS